MLEYQKSSPNTSQSLSPTFSLLPVFVKPPLKSSPIHPLVSNSTTPSQSKPPNLLPGHVKYLLNYIFAFILALPESPTARMFSLKYKVDSTSNFKASQFSILFRIEWEEFYRQLNCLWRSFPTTTQHHSYFVGSSISALDIIIIKHFVSWSNLPTSESLPMLVHLCEMLFSPLLHLERPYPALWTQIPIVKCTF